jgi:hypothetical protein
VHFANLFGRDTLITLVGLQIEFHPQSLSITLNPFQYLPISLNRSQSSSSPDLLHTRPLILLQNLSTREIGFWKAPVRQWLCNVVDTEEIDTGGIGD